MVERGKGKGRERKGRGKTKKKLTSSSCRFDSSCLLGSGTRSHTRSMRLAAPRPRTNGAVARRVDGRVYRQGHADGLVGRGRGGGRLLLLVGAVGAGAGASAGAEVDHLDGLAGAGRRDGGGGGGGGGGGMGATEGGGGGAAGVWLAF